MQIFNKDWIINLAKSILWQYDKAEKLKTLIYQKQAWYKKNVTDFIMDFFNNIFNIRTANDFGLSIWGKLLNFNRQVVNRNDGTIINLSTEQYRFLLLGQILKFKMNCTVPEINKYLSLIFNDTENKCYVIDNYDMSMQYIIEAPISDEIQVLIDNVDFLPRPAGVQININQTLSYTVEINVYDGNGNLITNSSTITFTVDGQTTTASSIVVEAGKTVQWSVSKSGYVTQTGTVTNIQSNQTVNVTLGGNFQLVRSLGNIIEVVADNIDITKTLITSSRTLSAYTQQYILNGNLYIAGELVDNSGDWTYINGNIAIRDNKIYFVSTHSALQKVLLNDTLSWKAGCGLLTLNSYVYGITTDNKLYRLSFSNNTYLELIAENVSLIVGQESQRSCAYYISDGKLYYATINSQDNFIKGQIGSRTDWIDISCGYNDALIDGEGYAVAISSGSGLWQLIGSNIAQISSETGWEIVRGNTFYGYALAIKNGRLYQIYSTSQGVVTINEIGNGAGWTVIGSGYGNNHSNIGYAIKDGHLYSISGGQSSQVQLIDNQNRYINVGGTSQVNSNLYSYAIRQKL